MLSKRLKTIANLVDTKNVYDVGCDHALLDIYLSNNFNKNCIAIDISEECVLKAKKNIEKNNSNVKVILNNGLENINILPDSTVIISGMGTKNIIKIINKKNIDNLICQSNKNIYELRKNVCKLGYFIIDGEIIFEDKYYIIIKFKKGLKKYTENELLLGPTLSFKKDETYIKYLNELKNNIEKNINKYDENKLQRQLQILNIIKKEL